VADPQISAIVPIYNEAPNLRALFTRLKAALDELARDWEMLLVDDGSTDDGPALLRELAKEEPRVRVLFLTRNFGQTAALAAGIEHARGDLLVTLDADLQNDPKDIASLIEKLESGYDVVSGWRKERKDPFLTKVLPSRIANWLIRRISGVQIHDLGCTLRVYRREILQRIPLYGEMHRFLPVLAVWEGARICELPVNHSPRTAGASKYGMERSAKVVLDMFTIQFLHRYGTKPLYLFGGLGLPSCALGVLVGGFTLYQRLAFGIWVHKNPLILLAVFLFLVGTQLLLMGLLAELIMRVYYESQGKRVYALKEPLSQNPTLQHSEP